MSKWFEITAETVRTFLVEVEDNETSEDAEKYVYEELMGEVETISTESEHKEDIEQIKKMFDRDKILSL